MRRTFLHTAVGIAVFSIGAFGQQGSQLPVGTGVLTGVVVTDDETPVPVRRATVRIMDRETVSPRLAGTDDNGRFTFTDLPPGRYTVSAMKPGFVETFHGARRPGRGPGIPVAVANGTTAEASLPLVRGGVISGVITNEAGQPAPGVTVAAVALPAAGGVPIATLPVRTETDDRGMYRLFGLAPGSYLISAVSRLTQASLAARGTTATAIAGLTDAERQWASSQQPTRLLPPPGRAISYAPIFFPGTSDAGAATPVTVRSGQEQSGIVMTMRPAPVATVSGRIINPDGQPVPTASAVMYWRQRSGPSPTDALATSGVVTLPRATMSPPNFSIGGVWPGEYTLVARSSGGQRGAPPPTPVAVLWNILDITVDGTDQTDIQLQLLPGLQLTGAVTFQGATTPPALDTFELTLRPHGTNISGVTSLRGTIDAEHRVLFPSIPPGRFLATSTIGGRWFLESLIVGSRDIADLPIEVTTMGGATSGAAVTFSDQPASVEGRLVDDTGAAVTRYAIVLFPVDKTMWIAQSRRVRLAQPATDGAFSITGLPAGTYAIAAAEDITAADLDTALFEELLASSHQFTLARGERKQQSLKTAR